MHGSMVYSSTGITSANSVVSLNHHTYCVYATNLSDTTDSVIKLNGTYSVLLPASPSGSATVYHQIPGDYTTIEVVTANTTVAFYAIG